MFVIVLRASASERVEYDAELGREADISCDPLTSFFQGPGWTCSLTFNVVHPTVALDVPAIQKSKEYAIKVRPLGVEQVHPIASARRRLIRLHLESRLR